MNRKSTFIGVRESAMRCPTGFLVGLMLLWSTQAFATNIHFLPGDAFFHTLLKEEDVPKLMAVQNPRFPYHYPSGLGAFCGDAGFAFLEYRDMSAAFKDNLKTAYSEIRGHRPMRVVITFDRNGTRREIGENRVHLLFYNADFDFETHRIFCKFNEDWVRDETRFGLPADQARLYRFVQDWDGSEWRDAAKVAPLTAELPEMPRSIRTLDAQLVNPVLVEKPIILRGRVTCLMIATEEFKKLAKPNTKISLLKVTDSGVVQVKILQDAVNYEWEEKLLNEIP